MKTTSKRLLLVFGDKLQAEEPSQQGFYEAIVGNPERSWDVIHHDSDTAIFTTTNFAGFPLIACRFDFSDDSTEWVVDKAEVEGLIFKSKL